MMRFLNILMIATAWQATALASDHLEKRSPNFELEGESLFHSKMHKKHCSGPTGPIGLQGDPGPNFDQYACLYSNEAQTLTIGHNVLFANEISLSGIQYDNTTGVFTLPPGTYSVTYFSTPTNVNLVSNGSIVPNSPLGGCITILVLTQNSNTLALQAQGPVSLSALAPPLCNAMITIYQID